MLFNRIINDIIDWVRRLLYWKENTVKKKPYTVIELQQSNHGLLRLVERDTPRAVCTYIYTPKPNPKTNVVTGFYDYHICLDHLWSIDNPELHVKSFTLNNKTQSFRTPKKVINKVRLGDPSHTITVLKSSRWLDKNGDYQTELLFYNTYDFVGRGNIQYRDKYAIPIFKDVVNQLKQNGLENFDWDWEITFSQKRFMGSYYIKPKDVNEASSINL